ncbi:MAG TPA: hypothetical protein VM582_03170, partial [Candidatus Thermoplasmatota archaeon]|nr:hypothetical protein [Candidatus Thermoplasmatota archaeon]
VPGSASAGPVDFALTDTDVTSRSGAFALAALALPGTLTLHADDVAGTLALSTQLGSLAAFETTFVHDRAACPAAMAPSHVTRQPRDTAGGSCLTAKLVAPVQALSVDLASGGPSIVLTSAAPDETPLVLLVRPGASAPRALDAYLSHVPASLSLRSTLGDAGATLAWAVAERVQDARVLARSGDTVLLWRATDAPLAAQASYRWEADAIGIEADGTHPGVLQLLLTNTGEVPVLPAGDYVTGIRGAGPSPAFAAAARLSATTRFQAALATEEFRVDARGGGAAALGIRYGRAGGPAFALDAAPGGSFELRALGQAGGSHRLEYQSAAPRDAIAWAGRFAGGVHVEGNVSGAPSSLALVATPGAGTLALDASAPIGRLEVARAGAGGAFATLAGEGVVHLARGGSFRVSVSDARTLALASAAGALTLSGTPSAHPLRVHVGGDSFASFESSLRPSSLALSYGRAGVGYTASVAGADVELRVMEPALALRFSARGIPARATLDWTSGAEATLLRLAHNGANAPLLRLEATFAPPGSSAASEHVHAHLEHAPADVEVRFERAAGDVRALAAPGPVGLLEYRHALGAEHIRVPVEPNHVLVSAEAEEGAFESLRIGNMTSLHVRVRGAAGEASRLLVHAQTDDAFYAEHARSEGAMRARLSNVPSRVDLQYSLASHGDNGTGLRIAHAGGGTLGALLLHAEQDGLALSLDATDVPAGWRASWAPARAFDLQADAPMRLHGLALRKAGAPAAALADVAAHVLVDATNALAPEVSAAFPGGVRRAYSDVVERDVRVAADASHATLRVVHAEGDATMTLDASEPSPSFALRAPPIDAEAGALAAGNVTLRWNALGRTGTLAWALDAANTRWRWDASSVPPLVRLDLDPARATLTASAPAGAGDRFALRYTRDGTGPFYGSQPGLVLLVNPTGP